MYLKGIPFSTTVLFISMPLRILRAMAAHLFVTGGTGLLGSYLLPRLLRVFPESRVTVLVRARDAEEARTRGSAISADLRNRHGMADAGERVAAVRGDVSESDLGLSPRDRKAILHSVTHIVHGAATIRFDHPIEEARHINCGGTRSALQLALEARNSGNLSLFAYIGSSSVSGTRAGRITEDELEMGQGFFNTYEQSKNESERIVRDHGHLLPTMIFRPSIVIGDSVTGRTTSFNVIYIPLRLLHKGILTFVPGTPDTTLDLVPVDWVGDVMAHLMTRDDAQGKVFHLTAGPQRAARLGDVVLGAIGYFEKRSPLSAPRTMEFISREEFERRRSRMRGMAEALMSQLDTLLPYVSIDRLFDSAHTDRLLEGAGIPFPRFNTYAERIFDYCLRSRWGKDEV